MSDGQRSLVEDYSIFAELVRGHDGALFRGQTTRHDKIIPSLFRQDPVPDVEPLSRAAVHLYFAAYDIDRKAAECREREMQTIEYYDDEIEYVMGIPTRPIIGHGFGSESDWDEHVRAQWRYGMGEDRYPLALLQHYGAPTPALDVSYSAKVALWFATHEFVYDPDFGRAWYEPADPNSCGIVYAMAVEAKQLIDLRGGRRLPIAGLRGDRQEGGLLLGATQASPDLSEFVVDEIAVLGSAFDDGHPDIEKLDQTFLFPSTDSDAFYGHLLAARESNDPEVRALASRIVDYRIG